MRIFAIADIHNRSVGKFEIDDVDVVVVAGDFTNADGVDFAKETIKKLEENFPEAKILAVPGNMDVSGVLNFLEEKGISIHGKVVEVNGIKIGGLGGSNVTPFSTPFELEEDEISSALENLLGAAMNGRGAVIDVDDELSEIIVRFVELNLDI